MRHIIFYMVLVILYAGCTPKHAQGQRELQTFSPIMIDMQKIELKEYTELINAVNSAYSPDKKEYVDARFLKEEAMYMYFHIYSNISTACFRVTVDKNRSRILNMQPDCTIEE